MTHYAALMTHYAADYAAPNMNMLLSMLPL